MSEQIWFKNPTVLFDRDTWSRFVPTKTMTTAEALNAVTRFSVYFSVILFAATGVSAYLLGIPIVMAASIALHTLFPNGKTLETFLTGQRVGPSYTMPSKQNPFMNVLLTEIQDAPNRGDAAPTGRSDVKMEIHKAFQQTSDIYMDTTDVFDQSQAMRTFHTMQSARVPNDLDGFKKFLSKDHDAPDYSSAPPARHGKLLNEGHVAAKGSMRNLPASTAKPTGTSPSAAKRTHK
jgi:hypothetical protein